MSGNTTSEERPHIQYQSPPQLTYFEQFNDVLNEFTIANKNYTVHSIDHILHKYSEYTIAMPLCVCVYVCTLLLVETRPIIGREVV